MTKRGRDFVVHGEKVLGSHGEKRVSTGHIGESKKGPICVLKTQGTFVCWRAEFLFFVERVPERTAECDWENHNVLRAKFLDQSVPASRR